MYLTIIILPLISSIVCGFMGRKVGTSGAQIISSLSLLVITLLSAVAFIETGMNNIPVNIKLFSWIDSESINILWNFNFDSLTVSMLIPVLVVSSLVHIYSVGYMSHDPHNQRFFSYLSLFTFMMIILVTSNNYLVMFVGWEGVGVCSYLLVNFWYTRIAANQSALAAFLTNRVGDCLLTIGMFALILTFGNLDYSTVFSLAPYVSENAIVFIGICLLIGAMAKSSQIGLHIWLPMAMEGPTPVSALIHAATMVTAGVYLLMRSSPLIEYSNTVLLVCLWIGAVTTVFSSLIGLFQQDIKKVIAYSTMSQLGMMVISVGLSSYNLALFHLMNHAFYKALLFLGAGAVIHAVSDNQDFRKYGGLKPFLPLTYSVMLIASLSLVAFPFMTGYYSKDFIIESAYGQFTFSGTSVYCISTIAAMFTTLYSVKVLYLTFITNPNGPLTDYKNAHEGDLFMSVPLMILAVFSVFFGYIFKDAFIGLGSGFFVDNSVFIHPLHEIMLDTEFAVPTIFKLIPLIFTISLSLVFIVLSEFTYTLTKFKLTRLGYNIYGFFNQRFFVELFYNTYITNVVLGLGGLSTKVVDKGSIELVGPYGLEKGLSYLSRIIAKLDTRVVTSYALYILVGITLYILIPYYYSTDTSIFIVLLLGLSLLTIRQQDYSLIYNTSLLYENIPYKKTSSLYWRLYLYVGIVFIINKIFSYNWLITIALYTIRLIHAYKGSDWAYNDPLYLFISSFLKPEDSQKIGIGDEKGLNVLYADGDTGEDRGKKRAYDEDGDYGPESKRFDKDDDNNSTDSGNYSPDSNMEIDPDFEVESENGSGNGSENGSENGSRDESMEDSGDDSTEGSVEHDAGELYNKLRACEEDAGCNSWGELTIQRKDGTVERANQFGVQVDRPGVSNNETSTQNPETTNTGVSEAPLNSDPMETSTSSPNSEHSSDSSVNSPYSSGGSSVDAMETTNRTPAGTTEVRENPIYANSPVEEWVEEDEAVREARERANEASTAAYESGEKDYIVKDTKIAEFIYKGEIYQRFVEDKMWHKWDPERDGFFRQDASSDPGEGPSNSSNDPGEGPSSDSNDPGENSSNKSDE